VNHHERTDVELLALSAGGDESAFRIIFRRHETAAYGLAMNMVRSPVDAEEVVGSAFFELWRGRDRVRFVDGSARPWLMVTVSHICRNQRRGRARYARLLAKVPPPESVPDHADEIARVLDAQREATEIRAALVDLREGEAAVVILCMLEEIPVPEAARLLGIPVGTAKSRLSRAKARMNGQLRHLLLRAEASHEG
jgi:RNA polymerase sigma factor (sigma-70 family)